MPDMILTDAELSHYRTMINEQILFASRGDTHKVHDMQKRIVKWIRDVAEAKVAAATGERVSLQWSTEALMQYGARCVQALKAADLGEIAWRAEMAKVEKWVSDYIQGAVFQATVKINSPKINFN